jgi:hypothetical protein
MAHLGSIPPGIFNSPKFQNPVCSIKVNRRAFLRTGATSTAIFLVAPSWCAEPKKSPPTDSEILADARASIERHRKGDATIRVQGADGKPLAGAKVIVEQLRHDFLFGCNLFLFGRCSDPDHEQEYRRKFAALFNYCTPPHQCRGFERPESRQPSRSPARPGQPIYNQNLISPGVKRSSTQKLHRKVKCS